MEKIIELIDEHFGMRDFMRSDLTGKTLKEFMLKITNGFANGNKLYIFGNGGSSADAQHIASEFVGRFEKKDRKPLPAMALTTGSSILTSVSNDFSYDEIFSRQVRAYARKYDLLWGISTSGNSKNVINALEVGKKIRTFNLSFTGRDGGKIKELSDLNFNVPYENTARIQEMHELAYHIICKLIDDKYGK